jgi:hypothetical protein
MYLLKYVDMVVVAETKDIIFIGIEAIVNKRLHEML